MYQLTIVSFCKDSSNKLDKSNIIQKTLFSFNHFYFVFTLQLFISIKSCTQKSYQNQTSTQQASLSPTLTSHLFYFILFFLAFIQKINLLFILMSEEYELPCNLDDFPNYHLKATIETIERETNQTDENYRNKLAFDYLSSLAKVLKAKIQTPAQKQAIIDQAWELYDNQFNKVLANSLFKDCEFPSAEQLEEKNDEEFDIICKLFYNETCNRHSFSKLFSQQFNIETALSSWRNYLLIFDTFLENRLIADLPIPPSWIWDILDEFVYQFYMCSKWKKNFIGSKETRVFWNLEQVIECFKNCINAAQINQPGFSIEVGSLKIIHYLGFYSLLALVKVYIMLADYQKAYELFSTISQKYLIVYSKCGGAYQALFTCVGFTYLMMSRYREAVKSFKLIVNFYNKYRQLYSKSFQYEQMNRNYEKAVSLLAISLIFYPEALDENLQTIFNETRIKRDRSQNIQYESINEKFIKLYQYDHQTFSDLFFFSSPKIVQPLLSIDAEQQEAGVNDLLNEQRDKLYEEMLKIQKLNNISSILKLYDKLTLSKMAKLLQISEDELHGFLKLYKLRSEIDLNQTPFEQTIISQYQGKSSMIDFKLENGVITVKQQQVEKVFYASFFNHQPNFGQQLMKLNGQLEKLMEKIINEY